MTFSCSFAPTMFGPVQRPGHQPYGGRIHHMNDPLETKNKTRLVLASIAGLQLSQMLQHRIKESLPQVRIAGAIGMRKRVFVRRLGSAQCRKRAGMEL